MKNQIKGSRVTLALIVLAQFCCTSLWFAGNGVMSDLVLDFNLKQTALGHLTSSVQFGFITGTLIFAILMVADRFSPSKVFFISAVTGSILNLFITLSSNSISSLAVIRFLTGFFLAGIYPVGMKIAADYFKKGLGLSLGYLVGALVVGTAFPHLIKNLTFNLPWKLVIFATSGLSFAGGLIMRILVPDGPYRKSIQKLDISLFLHLFKNRDFRSAAFGYFGHMWELYAFWSFVPVILSTYMTTHVGVSLNIPGLSFTIIGIGGIACVLGGYMSLRLGARLTAGVALAISGACCLLSPLLFQVNEPNVFIAFLLIWGMAVVADSPLFSTLVANSSKSENIGTALTLMNSIGFAITIISIQVLSYLNLYLNPFLIYTFLAIGPAFGIFALVKRKKNSAMLVQNQR